MNKKYWVKTSYDKKDVEVLLKDLSDCIKEVSVGESERLIQSGTHYSEIIPTEYKPSEEYNNVFNKALKASLHKTALYTAAVGEKLFLLHGKDLVLISLARAGTPVGILMKRYIKFRYNADVPHYTISIIRDKGIDENAMEYIYRECGCSTAEHFQFVDGWTGKGAISKQLIDAVAELQSKDAKWSRLSPDLAVIADPANLCTQWGTKADFLLPSACLNGTVSGLFSRTILHPAYIDTAKGDFHGAVYFKDLVEEDRSLELIDAVCDEFHSIRKDELYAVLNESNASNQKGIEVVRAVMNEYAVKDINKVKPGLGETTRVLLRRIPWKVLLNPKDSLSDDVKHILQLCEEKNVPVEYFDLGNYKACGIIKDLQAEERGG